GEHKAREALLKITLLLWRLVVAEGAQAPARSQEDIGRSRKFKQAVLEPFRGLVELSQQALDAGDWETLGVLLEAGNTLFLKGTALPGTTDGAPGRTSSRALEEFSDDEGEGSDSDSDSSHQSPGRPGRSGAPWMALEWVYMAHTFDEARHMPTER
ncbi:unnamed protein product, partial [Chrysoparadoxa australica]